MEKNGEFKPEQETAAQKLIQKLIVKTAEGLDEEANQGRLNIKHNITPVTKEN